MDNPIPASDPDRRRAAQPSSPAARGRRRWLPWLVLAGVALIGGTAFIARGVLSRDRPADGPLDGELHVVVRPPGRDKESLRVDEPGAVPVPANGWMSLEVRLTRPAYAYLVWLTADGKAVPLYPWNHEQIEVTDINQPPPVRKAATNVFNPPIGGGWELSHKVGLNTILLLVRRTHLPEGTRLGELLGPLPPAQVRRPDEVVVLGLNPGSDSVATVVALNRGPEDEARAADEPVRALLARLRKHFELIRAVRFANEGE